MHYNTYRIISNVKHLITTTSEIDTYAQHSQHQQQQQQTRCPKRIHFNSPLTVLVQKWKNRKCIPFPRTYFPARIQRHLLQPWQQHKVNIILRFTRIKHLKLLMCRELSVHHPVPRWDYQCARSNKMARYTPLIRYMKTFQIYFTHQHGVLGTPQTVSIHNRLE